MGSAPGIATSNLVEGLKDIERQAGQRLDRRARRTRANLADALFKLLQVKPLKEISVKELTELADVNRATFYAHYGSVADIAEQINSDLADTVRPLVRAHADEIRHGTFKPLIADIFHNFVENEATLTILFGPNADGSFLNEIIEAFRTETLAVVNDTAAHDETCLPLPPSQALCTYHFCFIAGGVSSIVQAWVSGGRTEPIEVMIDLATSYVDSATACLAPNIALYEQG